MILPYLNALPERHSTLKIPRRTRIDQPLRPAPEITTARNRRHIRIHKCLVYTIIDAPSTSFSKLPIRITASRAPLGSLIQDSSTIKCRIRILDTYLLTKITTRFQGLFPILTRSHILRGTRPIEPPTGRPIIDTPRFPIYSIFFFSSISNSIITI